MSGLEGSNRKTKTYQVEVTDAIEHFFPLKNTKRRSGDLPWINHAIRQRKAIYCRESRSAAWKRLKKVTNEMIQKRREKYILIQKDNLFAPDPNRASFKNVKLTKAWTDQSPLT